MEGGGDDYTGVCGVCGKETPLVCANCRSVRFCSHLCQRRAWKDQHRAVCGTIKGVRAQIKANKLVARGTKKEYREELVTMIGENTLIKEPSFKANGRLRGKQPRCTRIGCNAPAAVGVRYVSSFNPERKRSTSCESCWIAVLKEACDHMRGDKFDLHRKFEGIEDAHKYVRPGKQPGPAVMKRGPKFKQVNLSSQFG